MSGQAIKDKSVRLSRPFVLGAVATALAASAVFTVPSLGGAGPERAAFSDHHHSFARGTVSASATTGIGGIRNLEYKGRVKPGKEDGNRFTCPRRTPHAISGYFVPDTPEQFGKVQLADSFPSGKENRSWDIGVFNPTTETQTYYVGVVCVK
jgi:hypothetical protein